MMFIIANFLFAVAYILKILITVYIYILIARVLISWVNADPLNPIVRIIYQLTEPFLYRIRRTIPCIWGGLDFSPLIAMLILVFLDVFLVRTLFDLAAGLR